eukprot:RCo052504
MDGSELKLRVGIASSTVTFGNFGSDTMKVFTVVGEAVEQAVALQRVGCKEHDVPILVTEAVGKQVECYLPSLPCTVLRLAYRSPAKVVAGLQPMVQSTTEVSENQDMEWMYRLQTPGSPNGGGSPGSPVARTELQQTFERWLRAAR